MGQIKFVLPDDTEEKFREAAMDAFGHRKGAMSDAAAEALSEWSERVDGTPPSARMENPVEAIRGVLSHVEKGGVELQEEAGEIRAEEAASDVPG